MDTRDLADASASVKDTRGLVEGQQVPNTNLTFLRAIDNPVTGFSAAVFQAADGSIIATVRGVEITDVHDVAAVASVISGTAPPQFADAVNFVNEVRRDFGDNVNFTAHSLGAAALDYVAAKLADAQGIQLSVTTFGAIGVGQILTNEGINPAVLTGVTTNYFHPNDIANGVGQQVGDQRPAVYDPGILTQVFNFLTLAIGDVADSIEQHVIGSYQNSFSHADQPTPPVDVIDVVHQFVNGIALSEVVNAPSQFADLPNGDLPFGMEVEIFGSNGFDETIDPEGTVDVIDDGTGSGGGDPVIQVNGRAPAFFFHNGDFKIVAGDGNDSVDLRGSTGNNTLIAGNGNDVIAGGDGSNVIIAGDGNDAIQTPFVQPGTSGSNFIKVGNGNDTITVRGLDSTIVAGGGLDTIYGGPGNDIISVSVGTDWQGASIGLWDLIALGDGNNIFDGGSSADIVTFGLGNNTIIGGSGPHPIFQFGANIIFPASAQNYTAEQLAAAGDDLIVGGPNDDLIEGGYGNNTIYGGAGNDFITAGLSSTPGHHNVVFGGAGDDTIRTIFGGRGDFSGGPGDDTYYVDNPNEIVVELPNQGTDTVYSSTSYTLPDNVENLRWWSPFDSDGLLVFKGNASDNILEGPMVLDGSAGNDTLIGFPTRVIGDSHNTYVFGRGYGQDTVINNDPTPGILNRDVIRLNDDVLPSDVTLQRDADNLVLSVNGTEDKLTVQSFYAANLADNTDPYPYQIKPVEFADGTIWDVKTLGGVQVGEVFGDNTYAFGRGSGQVRVVGYGSFDTVQMGDDVLPDDVTVARAGDNLVLGIVGTTDQFSAQLFFRGPAFQTDAYQIEQVQFTDGTTWDTAALLDHLFVITGTDQDDFLGGTAGDNFMQGLGGNDTLFGGDGNDTLDGGLGNDFLVGGPGNDTYLFDRGYGQDTIYDLNYSGHDMNTIRMGADVAPTDVTLQTDVNGDLLLGINGTSDQLTVQNYFVDPVYQVEQIAFADGTIWDTNTILSQTPGLVLAGTDGPDFLQGSPLADVISGLGGDDYINAGAGNDTLDGGTGNDTLIGGPGSDTYLFGRGYGRDEIFDFQYSGTDLNTIRVAADVSPDDVTVQSSQDNLVLSISGTEDQLTVDFYFSNPAYQVEQVAFADGTIWDTSTIINRGQGVALVGTDGPDHLSGGFFNDTLDGGAGNDFLAGGPGNDTYLFGRGYGQDILFDQNYSGSDMNTVRLSADVAPTDVTLQTDVNGDLLLGINGTSDQLTVQNYFVDPVYQVEQIAFADGTIWDTNTILSQTPGLVVTGTDDGDFLQGSPLADVISGLGGDDYINAGAGNDTLDGGTGNDTLIGGPGSDTYLFGRGYGQDEIFDFQYSGTDFNTVRMAADISPDDLTVQDGRFNSLVLCITGTDDQPTVDSYFSNPVYQVEQVEFADGTIWDTNAIFSRGHGSTITGSDGFDFLQGTPFGDVLMGLGGNDFLAGGTGNDTLIGGAGNDTFVFNLGDGVDTIEDTAAPGEGNTLLFGAGITPDSLSLSLGSLLIRVGSNGDAIHIANFDPNDALGPHAIDTFQFADGTALTYADLIGRGFDRTGPAGQKP